MRGWWALGAKPGAVCARGALGVHALSRLGVHRTFGGGVLMYVTSPGADGWTENDTQS